MSRDNENNKFLVYKHLKDYRKFIILEK